MSEHDTQELETQRHSRTWQERERWLFWAKMSIVVGPTVALLTALSTCAINGMDLQTKTAAATEHLAIEEKAEETIEKEIAKVDASINRLSDRIDAALSRRRR